MSLDLMIIHERTEEEILDEIREARKNKERLETVDVEPTVWWENITHNLGTMAKNVPVSRENTSLYNLLWKPGEAGFSKVTGEYISLVKEGLEYLRNHELELSEFNPANHWGSYSGLLDFTRSLVFFLQNIKDYDKSNYIIVADV